MALPAVVWFLARLNVLKRRYLNISNIIICEKSFESNVHFFYSQVTIAGEKPEEACSLEPQRVCKHVTKLVPQLKAGKIFLV